MSKNDTKERVLQAALALFYQKGFHATSVRDIAHRAKVNISLISYYFDSKQGLLEFAVVHYYEEYLKELERILEKSATLSSLERLKKLILSIIQYKYNHQKFSSFIHREMSIDSTFMREVFMTYIAKENFYLKELFNPIFEQTKTNRLDREFLFMQLKGMLATPFMMQNEFKETILHPTMNQYFVEKYTKMIFSWLDIVTKIR